MNEDEPARTSLLNEGRSSSTPDWLSLQTFALFATFAVQNPLISAPWRLGALAGFTLKTCRKRASSPFPFTPPIARNPLHFPITFLQLSTNIYTFLLFSRAGTLIFYKILKLTRVFSPKTKVPLSKCAHLPPFLSQKPTSPSPSRTFIPAVVHFG